MLLTISSILKPIKTHTFYIKVMGDLGKQPIGTGISCRKANGRSFGNLPANRWQIKKRILKELIFGDAKEATRDGRAELPPSRWKIKKRLLK